MIEKINKLIEPLLEDYSGYIFEVIQNVIADEELYYSILLIKNSDIVKIYEIGINEKLEQVDVTQNMLGLINNIRRKNLCVR